MVMVSQHSELVIARGLGGLAGPGWHLVRSSQAQHSLCLRDYLDAGYPYKHMRRALLEPEEWIRTVTVRIRCESGVRIKKSPDSRIRIRRHSPLVWCDFGSGPRPDPESLCVSCLMYFFDGSGLKNPDPGSRHTQQLQKKFKHDILEEKWARATFRWTHICFFLDFSFKKCGTRFED